MIKNNVKNILNELSNLNPFNEKVTLVGATKFVSVENINESIDAGLSDIGENKAQEFRDKFNLVKKVNYHFFGTLQKNKVKYLIGKVYLIHSVDSIDLIKEIDLQSQKANVTTNVLLEVNLGEEQKGGFPLNEIENVLSITKNFKHIKVKGLMAMLPNINDEPTLINLIKQVRKTYDNNKQQYGFEHLSMGMSNDYKLCVKYGSNMVRIGSSIYGKRN